MGSTQERLSFGVNLFEVTKEEEDLVRDEAFWVYFELKAQI